MIEWTDGWKVINFELNGDQHHGFIKVTKLNRGHVWLDAGLPSSLHQASSYIQTIQERQGVSIGCIEEECYRAGFINKDQLKKRVSSLPECEYKLYLNGIINES